MSDTNGWGVFCQLASNDLLHLLMFWSLFAASQEGLPSDMQAQSPSQSLCLESVTLACTPYGAKFDCKIFRIQ